MSFMGVCEYPILNTKKKSKPKHVKKKKPNKNENLEEKTVSDSKLSNRSSCSFHMNNRKSCLDPECDSEPDRSEPLWKIVDEQILEEPKDVKCEDAEKTKPNLWNEIMTEYEDKRLEFFNLLELSKPYEPQLPVCSKLSAVQYLEKYIFPILCPALEETLFKAKEWECLLIQKCRFNGLDYISELLWNRNPLHPKRLGKQRNIFDIPFVIIWLYYNPRPIFPLSWLWSKEEAIIVLQTYIRRYLVCREPECSEMRQFWKTVKQEKEDEKQAKRLRSMEQIEELFNQILDKLVADAVFQVEWKIHGCHCVKTPCHCVCKCMKWCKCCNCYKLPAHDTKSCSCSRFLEKTEK